MALYNQGCSARFFTFFIVQYEESSVNFTRSIYFQFFLINFSDHNLKNQNSVAES